MDMDLDGECISATFRGTGWISVPSFMAWCESLCHHVWRKSDFTAGVYTLCRVSWLHLFKNIQQRPCDRFHYTKHIFAEGFMRWKETLCHHSWQGLNLCPQDLWRGMARIFEYLYLLKNLNRLHFEIWVSGGFFFHEKIIGPEIIRLLWRGMKYIYP